MSEREVLLRICEAYGGNPNEDCWHSVEGVAAIIEDLSGQCRALARQLWVAEHKEKLDG